MNPFDLLDFIETNWADAEAVAAITELPEPDFGPEMDLWAIDEEIGE